MSKKAVTPIRRAMVAACSVIVASVFGVLGKTYIPDLPSRIVQIGGKTPSKLEGNDALFFTITGTVGSALLGAVLGAWLCGLVIDFFDFVGETWDRMQKGDRLTIILSVFAGIIITIPILLMLNTIQHPLVPYAMVLTAFMTVFVSVVMVNSVRELFPWSRELEPPKRSGIKILDTNVFIDGRIYEVARTGFLEGEIYVPHWVLEELQHIADHHDSLKRQRGRRGLDILRHLQLDFTVEVGTKDHLVPESKDPVDSRLVKLALALGADIVTNDFNLNQVAGIQGVRVLNLNDLSLAVRTNMLPNERINLLISKEGNQHGQGVGYLEDGTMVVVENGREYIGDTVHVTINQVHQSTKGKMIFAEVDPEEQIIERRGKR